MLYPLSYGGGDGADCRAKYVRNGPLTNGGRLVRRLLVRLHEPLRVSNKPTFGVSGMLRA